MPSHLIKITTSKAFSFHSITDQLQSFLKSKNVKEGLLVAFGNHTTTALIINEMEERLVVDLGKWLKELIPPLKGYKHDDLHLRDNIPADEPKNAHAHIQALLLSNQVSVPFKDGKLQLGQYQDVIVVELGGPRERSVVVSIK